MMLTATCPTTAETHPSQHFSYAFSELTTNLDGADYMRLTGQARQIHRQCRLTTQRGSAQLSVPQWHF